MAAPARIVLTGRDFNSTLRRRGALDTRNNEVDNDNFPTTKNGTEKLLGNTATARRNFRRRQESLLSDVFNQRRQNLNNRDSPPLFSLFNRNSNGSGGNIQQIFSRSLDDFTSGSNVIRTRSLGRLRGDNRNSDGNTSDSNIFSTRGLGRSLLRSSLISGAGQESDNRLNRPLNFLGFGTLGSALALNNRTNSRGGSNDEREKTVFEKNFEASKTQASIDKLGEAMVSL